MTPPDSSVKPPDEPSGTPTPAPDKPKSPGTDDGRAVKETPEEKAEREERAKEFKAAHTKMGQWGKGVEEQAKKTGMTVPEFIAEQNRLANAGLQAEEATRKKKVKDRETGANKDFEAEINAIAEEEDMSPASIKRIVSLGIKIGGEKFSKELEPLRGQTVDMQLKEKYTDFVTRQKKDNPGFSLNKDEKEMLDESIVKIVKRDPSLFEDDPEMGNVYDIAFLIANRNNPVLMEKIVERAKAAEKKREEDKAKLTADRGKETKPPQDDTKDERAGRIKAAMFPQAAARQEKRGA